MFRLCERCSTDNAYLGELLLGGLFILLGLVFGLVWLAASRREGLRGFAAGAIPALGAGAVIVVVGSTRMVGPAALLPVALVLVIAGAAAATGFAAREDD